MEANSTSESGKKVALENLSREELIKRCERLLSIAQKAKQAKDILQEENDDLRNQCKSETGRNAANEIVERLTEQKLGHVNTIEDLKKQNSVLNSKLQQYTLDLQVSEENRNTLDNENVSFKRQLKRLTDENEQLLTHLEALERQTEECKQLGLEQQNQLLILEQSKEMLEAANQKLQHENSSNNSAELEKMLNISLQEVKKLQAENKSMTGKVEDLRMNLSEKDKNILVISQELQDKAKLVQNLKAQIEENTKLGSESDLSTENQKLQKKVEDLSVKMGELQNSKQDNEILMAQIQELEMKYEDLRAEMEELQSNKQELEIENKNLKAEIEESHCGSELVEGLKTQREELQNELGVLKGQNTNLLDRNANLEEEISEVRHLQSKLEALIKELEALKSENGILRGENEELRGSNTNIEQEISEVKHLQEDNQSKLEALNSENGILRTENGALLVSNANLEKEISEIRSLQEDNQSKLAGSIKELEELKIESGILRGVNEELLVSTANLQREFLGVKQLQEDTLTKLEEMRSENGILRTENEDLRDTNATLEKENSEVIRLQEDIKSKVEAMKSDNEILRAENEDLRDKNTNIEKEISEVGSKEQEESKLEASIKVGEVNDKLKEKLKSYHGKIVKLAGNVKALKENKNEIFVLMKTYTTQVEEWKEQLSVASLKLIQHITNITTENLEYLAEINVLRESNAKFIQQLEAHKTDDEKSKELNQFEHIKNENKRLAEEVVALVQLQNEYQNQIEDLMAERDEINGKLVELVHKHEDDLRVCDDQSRKDTVEIQNRKDENEKICLEYRKVISKLELDLGLCMREVEELRQKNYGLEESLQHVKDTEQQIADRTSEEILKLVQENADLMEISRKLEQKHNNVTHVECQTVDNASGTDLEEVVTSLKRENAELLAEMNEMNQALKERGETISKFQAHCEEVMKKLQIYESQANRNVDNISQKEEVIKKLEQEIEKLKNQELVVESAVNVDVINKKDLEISDLKSEIEALKERLNSNLDTSYAESENMSTSTISRTDEANRLKDLEGSWEERYGKLRTLAVKLKGKVRDLSSELVKEQNEKNDLQQKCANNVKTIATLQAQCDQIQDELEARKHENKEYSDKLDSVAVDISKDKQKLAGNDDVIVKLKKENEELNQEKINTEAWKKQISGKVQAFRKELEVNKVLKKEYEAKIAKLTTDLDAKQQALKAESDGHQQTRHSLEHSNSERMKNSVLSLEMQDYERSVKELSQKLEKKQEEIGKLKGQLDSQKSTANAIREQNKLLEERAEEMKTEFSAIQSEMISYKKQVSELEEVVLQKDNKIQNLTQLLEAVRSENEELSTELSKVISEHQKLHSGLRSEKELLRGQVLGLQQSLREVQDTLKLKEDELRIVQTDYNTYKVRAQSVLRQNQNRDVGLEEKISEELSTLQARCERLATESKECKDTIASLRKENESLSQQKSDISSKYEDVSSEIEDLKSLYDQLSSKHQQTVIENAETVRSLKVHAETLAQCYRQQLSEQEVRHNREIIELQSKMEKAPSPTEIAFPPLPTMHREEGEGSESTENTSKNLHPVPLERLLGTDTDQEMTFMKKQLGEEESKVTHLTALLADTEQDLAKHVQMNKLLKEEIRRQQRSVEREKHAENLEYLKNVVFKFVTLHSGDERTRLVPVLNTILKLSPEETQKLTMVARGDPGMRGWTNYLPLWPSPSKP